MRGFVRFCTFLLAMAIVCMMMTSKPTDAMSCGDIDSNLSECIWYLTGRHAEPSRACCEGCRRLVKLGTTSDNRRVACDCLRESLLRLHGIGSSLTDSLPGKCSAKLPYFKYRDSCDGDMP